MKQMMQLAFSALALIAASANADDIRMGTPTYGGSGCPAGTAALNLTEDGKSLSVIFDQFTVNAGAATNQQVDRKACSLAIPVHLPQGYSISVYQVDFRGYSYIPSGGLGRFRAESTFDGNLGAISNKSFVGPVDKNFLVSQEIEAESEIWSRCGEDVQMRINTSIMARTNSRMDDTLIGVDSTDVRSELIYHFKWRRCSGY